MQNMPTATELAIKYAKREQLRIIIEKAYNIHADCEYEALSIALFNKKGCRKCNSLFTLVAGAGFEPTTFGL